MSETTNLKLFKHDNPSTNENQFNVEEALNENWDKIDNFAGTTNKDIADINERDTEQDELISKVRNAALNAETEESKSLCVTDANKFGSLEVLGNQEQETREGYNVLNLKDWITSESVKINVEEIEENAVQLKTNVSDASAQYYLRLKNTLPTGTYYFQRKFESIEKGTGGSNYGLIFISKSDWSKEYCRLTPTDNKKSFTLDSETEVVMTLFLKGTSDTGTEEREIRYYDMMLSNSDLEYEDFGESPSLNYPSQIVCLQNSTEIKKINKNLININAETIKNNNYGELQITNDQIFFKSTEKEYGTICKTGWILELTDIFKDIYVSAQNITRPYTNNAGIFYKFVDKKPSNLNSITDFTGITSSINGTQIKITPTAKYLIIMLQSQYVTTTEKTEDRTITIDKLMVSYSSDLAYKSHEEESYILNIQQEMLKGDYFVKEDDNWKEVHCWKEKVFDGTESLYDSTDNNIYVQYEVENVDFTCERQYCNYLDFIKDETTLRVGTKNGFTFASFNDRIWFNNKNTTLEKASDFKAWLQQKYSEGNPLKIKYKTTVETKIICTEQQKIVLEKLNNLELFEGANNIITAEDIALLKLKYALDVKTYVDNQISNLQEQLDTINELLSTTQTSSMLLDNLQTDLESEVM